MESMAAWAGVEPYGLEISPELAELARRRLPQWADRIWVGNAPTWTPPRRFDVVRTGLDYVPLRVGASSSSTCSARGRLSSGSTTRSAIELRLAEPLAALERRALAQRSSSSGMRLRHRARRQVTVCY